MRGGRSQRHSGGEVKIPRSSLHGVPLLARAPGFELPKEKRDAVRGCDGAGAAIDAVRTGAVVYSA